MDYLEIISTLDDRNFWNGRYFYCGSLENEFSYAIECFNRYRKNDIRNYDITIYDYLEAGIDIIKKLAHCGFMDEYHRDELEKHNIKAAYFGNYKFVRIISVD